MNAAFADAILPLPCPAGIGRARRLVRCLRRGLAIVLLFLLPLSGAKEAVDAAEAILLARQRLGPGLWSKAVEFELNEEMGSLPRNVKALVFEFQDILWLYTPYDGTRSLSERLGSSEADKGRIATLLKDAFPELVAVRDLELRESGAHVADKVALVNGCFVDSIAALRREIDEGVRVVKASLLCLYFIGDGIRGAHTVLFIETPERRFVVDPARETRSIAVPADAARSAIDVADIVVPWGRPVMARWVPVIEEGVRVSLSPRAMARAIAPQS